jgi:hypothetical protein
VSTPDVRAAHHAQQAGLTDEDLTEYSEEYGPPEISSGCKQYYASVRPGCPPEVNELLDSLSDITGLSDGSM